MNPKKCKADDEEDCDVKLLFEATEMFSRDRHREQHVQSSTILHPGILPHCKDASQQELSPNNSPVTKDRLTIWQGILKFKERPNSQEPGVFHFLTCTFSSRVSNSGGSDVNADKWPSNLMLQLLPRQRIFVGNNLTTLKTAAFPVLIHFNQESAALVKLCKIMSSNLVGCIQFPQTCDIKIMVVLFLPEKQIYMGFIPHDQERFFINILQIDENHYKQLTKRMLKWPQNQMVQEEEEFEKQFKYLEKQFETLKERNINHPDKEAFAVYEKQFQEWRAQVLQDKAERAAAKAAQPAMTAAQLAAPNTSG